MGSTWVYDRLTRKFPILQCPTFMVNTATKGFADGPFCRITLANNGMNQQGVIDNPDCQMPPMNSEDYIVCLIDAPCRSACNLADTNAFCPDATMLTEPTPSDEGPECDISLPGSETFSTPCFFAHWTPFCESTFRVTPGAILAMRSLIAGTGVMLTVWLFAEITLWSAEKVLRKDAAAGRLRQQRLLPTARAELRAHLERVWNAAADDGASSSEVTSMTPNEWESEQGRRTALYSRDPRKRFTSVQWKRRVTQWKSLHLAKSKVYKTTVFMRSISLSLFFVAILIVAMFTIISVSPSQIPAHADALTVLDGTARILPLYTWMDGLIFIDILLDFGLFAIACMSVSWPTSPIFASHMRAQLDALEKRRFSEHTRPGSRGSVSEADDDDSLESVMNQAMTLECCLLIACHESCLTTDKEESFVNTLRAALRVFPPNHIFVCDNGSALTPVDCTELVAKSVHQDINYLYIPEGNKTVSFFWYVSSPIVPATQ